MSSSHFLYFGRSTTTFRQIYFLWPKQTSNKSSRTSYHKFSNHFGASRPHPPYIYYYVLKLLIFRFFLLFVEYQIPTGLHNLIETVSAGLGIYCCIRLQNVDIHSAYYIYGWHHPGPLFYQFFLNNTIYSRN